MDVPLEVLNSIGMPDEPPSPLESLSMSSPDLPDPSSSGMERSYIQVLVVWAVTLAALYAFQQYFS
jgi:hypothetical protein